MPIGWSPSGRTCARAADPPTNGRRRATTPTGAAKRALFEEVAVITGWRPTLIGSAEPEPIPGEQVSHEYLSVLGIVPALGRTFSSEDDVPNAPRVVIISDGLWRRRFGAAADVVGKTVVLSGQPHEIIGVLPAGFRPIVSASADLWRPLRLNTATRRAEPSCCARSRACPPDCRSIARRRPPTSLARRLEAQHPEFNEKTGINADPLQRSRRRRHPAGSARAARRGGVRPADRLREHRQPGDGESLEPRPRDRRPAWRSARARARLIRQLLTESLLLAASAASRASPWAGGRSMGSSRSRRRARRGSAKSGSTSRLRRSSRLLSVVTGVLFGLMPALHSSRRDIVQPLKEAARGTVMAAGAAVRRALIAAEVALALMLLTGGGLLLQTFVHLRATNLGFDPDNVLVGFVNPPGAGGYDTAAKHRAFYDQVLETRAGAARRAPGRARLGPAARRRQRHVLHDRGPARPVLARANAGHLVPPGERRATSRPWGCRLRAGRASPTAGGAVSGGQRNVRPQLLSWRRTARTASAIRRRRQSVVHHRRHRSRRQGAGARESTQVEMFIPYWQFTEPRDEHRAAQLPAIRRCSRRRFARRSRRSIAACPSPASARSTTSSANRSSSRDSSPCSPARSRGWR